MSILGVGFIALGTLGPCPSPLSILKKRGGLVGGTPYAGEYHRRHVRFVIRRSAVFYVMSIRLRRSHLWQVASPVLPSLRVRHLVVLRGQGGEQAK